MATASSRAAPRAGVRWFAAPVVAAAFVGGVWLTGGVIAGTFRTAMGLTALWYLLAAALCVALVRRGRALRAPVIAGYLVAAGAVAAYLAVSTLHERVVHEHVAVGAPASHAPTPAGGQAANVQLASGVFASGEHETTGTAHVVRLAGGRRVLTLTGFSTSPGPDLRVRVAPGGGTDGSADGVADLGALKGNRGDQQYELPAGLAVRGATVLIWCRAFSALFGSAALRAS